MDEIVRQAMAKWPNVPHCYGWLALDARGHWRMRDDRAQHFNLPGDRLFNAALVGFIERNYGSDEHGRWYFQNGPQRVYVNLETTPYIARTDGAGGFVLHTGVAVAAPSAAWMTEEGRLVLDFGGRIAMVEDRDMAACLAALKLDGVSASDEDVLRWLAGGDGVMTLDCAGGVVTVQHVDGAALDQAFGFVKLPHSLD